MSLDTLYNAEHYEYLNQETHSIKDDMIKYVAYFSNDTIKLIGLHIKTKKIIALLIINKADIQTIQFDNNLKQFAIYFKNKECIDNMNNYYDQLFNHYCPPIDYYNLQLMELNT